MVRKKLLSVALASVLAVSTCWSGSPDLYQSIFAKAQTEETEEVVEDASQVDASSYGLRDNIQDGVILHCFDWKYNDIKAELPNIAKAGFTAVQTSPAQKGDGDTWYWLYQPQTFSIQPNALGNKAELTELCAEAEKYGIKIIVDVVANHTRSIGDDGLGSDCFHSEGDAWYSDRHGITYGRIGMPDLASENPKVQNKVKGYIEELKSVGVDGIRWDAAKHIGLPSENCQFWPVVTSVGLYNYGEILVGPLESGGESLMKEYTDYVSVTDSMYGQAVRDAFDKGGVPGSIGNWCERGVAKNKLVYWSESHDTYSNNGEYGEATQLMNQNVIDRGYAIVAAQANATALYFSRPFETNKQSIKAGVKGSTHFKDPEVAAVNHFHNACVGEREYYVNGGSAAAVCRESGAVVVKGSGSGQVSIKNGGGLTKPGTYKDEITGSTWTVTADTISGSVGDTGIAVFYDGSNNGGNNGGGTTTTTAPQKTTDPDSGSSTAKANTIVATKPSGWNKMKIYAYTTGADGKVIELTGAWESAAEMTAASDGTYTYTFESSVTSAKVIFTDGGSNQDPANVLGQQCGFDYVGGKAYSYKNGTWKEEKIVEATKAPTATPKVTPTAKVTATPKVTEKPTTAPTAKVTPTPTPTATAAADEQDLFTVSKASGTSFTEETMDVKITLKDAESGTYCVDNGPVKNFTGSVTVKVGQGKIADSDVKLEVAAKSAKKETTKIYTYKKVFDPATATVKTSAVRRIASLFEVVSEAAQVNAAAESEAYYATNPASGVGAEKTITQMADFTQDMLIARSGAWDVPNAWHGAHENSVADCYGLYAAWDNDNLYIGLEMVNTTDTWAKGGDGPLSDGGKMSDVPVVLAINTGRGNKMSGKCPTDKDGYPWQCHLEFETRIDHMLFASAKGTGNPGLFTADEQGNTDYTEHLVGFKDAGITYKIEDGSIAPEIMHLVGSSSISDANDISKYQDAMEQGHSREYDTFFTYTIPFSAIGIDKDYLTTNGIGVMGLGTRQTSALDCIPHDPSMLDNTMEDYSLANDNTSHEKEDLDIITVPLAAVGNMKAGGEGSGGAVATKSPATSKPSASSTVAPSDKATATPKTTATPKATTTPEATATAAPTADVSKLTVNFGADRSSPQYDTTELTLKAIASGGSGSYTYEFQVDSSTVQKASSTDTYKWTGSTGSHKIKVIVKDSKGNTVTSEKAYVLEKTAGMDINKDPQETKKPELTPLPTEPVPETPTEKLALNEFAKQTSPQKAGTAITVGMNPTGGTAPYTYTIKVKLSGDKKYTSLLVNSNSNSCIWTPVKQGTYTVYLKVKDAKGEEVSKSLKYKVTSGVSFRTCKPSKSTIKKGQKVKFTMKATSKVKAKIRYKIVATTVEKKPKKTTLRNYSTKTTCTWKPKKKCTYKITITAKDTKGNTASKTFKVKVK